LVRNHRERERMGTKMVWWEKKSQDNKIEKKRGDKGEVGLDSIPTMELNGVRHASIS
jgi:hypothetical protein